MTHDIHYRNVNKNIIGLDYDNFKTELQKLLNISATIFQKKLKLFGCVFFTFMEANKEIML